MKIPGLHPNIRLNSVVAMIAVMAIVVLIAGGTVWAAGGAEEHAVTSEHATAGGEHGAAQEGHGAHWQATDWYRVLNFVILAVALIALLRKPASQALNNRIKSIKDELEDLESRKTAVEKQLADYNNKLALLDKEAEQIIAQYVQQGEDAKARILKEAEVAAEKLKEQAKKNIDHEFKQAKLQLQVEIVEKALAKAEKLIADRISDEDQGRLVDEYLDKVVA
jgi:F-type H+-transporting ATPase subunit b